MNTTPLVSSMEIPSLVAAAFQLYRKNFIIFIGIVAVIQLPFMILQLLADITLVGPALAQMLDFSFYSELLQAPSNQNNISLNTIITFFATTISFLVVQSLITQNLIICALVNATDSSLRDEALTILGAYRLSIWTFVSLIIANMATILIVMLPSGLFIACGIAFFSSSANNGALMGVTAVVLVLGGLILLIPSMLFFFVLFQLVPQIIVLENTGILGSLSRSAKLVKGSFVKAFLLIATMGVINFLLSSVFPELVGSILNFADSNLSQAVVLTHVVASLISGIGYSLWMPLQVIAYTLLYKDLVNYKALQDGGLAA